MWVGGAVGSQGLFHNTNCLHTQLGVSCYQVMSPTCPPVFLSFLNDWEIRWDGNKVAFWCCSGRTCRRKGTRLRNRHMLRLRAIMAFLAIKTEPGNKLHCFHLFSLIFAITNYYNLPPFEARKRRLQEANKLVQKAVPWNCLAWNVYILSPG